MKRAADDSMSLVALKVHISWASILRTNPTYTSSPLASFASSFRLKDNPIQVIMISQILLFDQPRSASHLLYRLFSQQSQLKYLGHPFAWSRGKQVEWLMGDSYETGMTDSVQGAFDVAVRDGIEKWENALEDAQQSVSDC